MEDIQEIEWKVFGPPPNFPCFCCGSKTAKYRAKLRDNEATVNLCLCEDCIRLSDREILDAICHK